MSSAPSLLPALSSLLGYHHQKPFPVPHSLSSPAPPALLPSFPPPPSLMEISRGKGWRNILGRIHADPAKMAQRVLRVFVFLGLRSQEATREGQERYCGGYCRAQRQKSEASWVFGLPFALPQPAHYQSDFGLCSQQPS